MRAKSQHRWMSVVLIAAGIYNLVWGALVILWPNAFFHFIGADLPRYPQIWQCVGMIVGVYGIGYLIASIDPLTHWPITLVGLLGKVFGPIGFATAFIRGELPLAFGATILTNDLIWWFPFAAILFHAFKQYSDVAGSEAVDFAAAVSTAVSHRGATMEQLSAKSPTLVVFLRQAGCSFCREMLNELSQRKRKFESSGITLAIVHMSPPLAATQLFGKYGLDSIHRFSDPNCALYRAFDLPRGNFRQLFGLRVWLRFATAAIAGGHGIGLKSGDGFRMPGAFLLIRGKVVRRFVASSAGDRPDYEKILGIVHRHSSTHHLSDPNAHELAAQT